MSVFDSNCVTTHAAMVSGTCPWCGKVVLDGEVKSHASPALYGKPGDLMLDATGSATIPPTRYDCVVAMPTLGEAAKSSLESALATRGIAALIRVYCDASLHGSY